MKIISSIIMTAALSACAMTSLEKGRGEKQAAQASALLGVWESSCSLMASGYLKTQRIFSAETVEIQNRSFATSDCSGAPFQVLSIQAGYVIGQGDHGQPTPIDIQYISAALTVNDAVRVTTYNDQRLYDRDDWAVGKPLDILDRTPAPGQLPTVKKGEVVFALFQLVNGKLHHSDFSTGDGTSPERRPTKVRMGNGDTRTN